MSKRLKFDDIDEWTPSSISIVDEPFHPLCKFEVYEDDDEYVMKSIETITDGEVMSKKDIIEEEPMVSGPASFFKDLFNRNVAKSEEVPEEPPKKEEDSEVLAYLKKLDARITKLEEDKKPAEPVKEAVAKSEGETEGETEPTTKPTETEEKEEEVVDQEEVVTKSIDPDMVQSNMDESEKSFCERMGRNENGMTW